jgi:hypothetical protein
MFGMCGFSEGLSDDLQKFRIIDWLLEIGLRSRLDRAFFVCSKVPSGDDDNGNHRQRGPNLEFLYHNEAIATRQT